MSNNFDLLFFSENDKPLEVYLNGTPSSAIDGIEIPLRAIFEEDADGEGMREYVEKNLSGDTPTGYVSLLSCVWNNGKLERFIASQCPKVEFGDRHVSYAMPGYLSHNAQVKMKNLIGSFLEELVLHGTPI